ARGSGKGQKEWKGERGKVACRAGQHPAGGADDVAAQGALQRCHGMAVAERSAQGPLDLGENGGHRGPALLRLRVRAVERVVISPDNPRGAMGAAPRGGAILWARRASRNWEGRGREIHPDGGAVGGRTPR